MQVDFYCKKIFKSVKHNEMVDILLSKKINYSFKAIVNLEKIYNNLQLI